MSNSGNFKSVGGFEGRLFAKGCMCQKKVKSKN
jgi:hypothetical protein